MVYNFQVEDYHTYYVASGVLVHNNCGGETAAGTGLLRFAYANLAGFASLGEVCRSPFRLASAMTETGFFDSREGAPQLTLQRALVPFGNEPSIAAAPRVRRDIPFGNEPGIAAASRVRRDVPFGKKPGIAAASHIRRGVPFGKKPGIAAASHVRRGVPSGKKPGIAAASRVCRVFRSEMSRVLRRLRASAGTFRSARRQTAQAAFACADCASSMASIRMP